ncbi:MAG TPA: hypothetical protein VMW01_15515 [Williamwhitmania sp.]|nr:hypothetical protein [Williamwhitmania sp.]
MKRRGLLILGFVFITGILAAQKNFRPGYVIKAAGDTLIGEIDYRGDLLMGKICGFKTNAAADEVTYTPADIVGYRFNDGKYYVSKEVNGKMVFVEYLVKGYLNLYYLRDDNGDHYFLRKGDTDLVEIPYEEGIRVKDGKEYFYKSTKHIGVLNYFTQEVPELQSRIASMRTLDHDNLKKLVENYNNKVGKDQACIVFEKVRPSLKVELEVLGGVASYTSDLNLSNKNYFQMGVIGHFWMPRTSEKIYCRTGIIWSHVDEINLGSRILYYIPVQLEYVYPKGIVRPRFAFGFTFSPEVQSFSYMGGVDIKLHKSVSLGLSVDVNIKPNDFFVISDNIRSLSVMCGLAIKL